MIELKIGNLAARADDSDSDLDQPKLLLNRNDSVATSISSEGHVSKRRVRSKPSRSEMFEDASDSPFVVRVSILLLNPSVAESYVFFDRSHRLELLSGQRGERSLSPLLTTPGLVMGQHPLFLPPTSHALHLLSVFRLALALALVRS